MVKPCANRWVIAAASAALVLGAVLSRVIEPGVRVEKLRLAQDTPALRFSTGGGGARPVALLAHGFAASKETLFRYGEALAAAGFICYSVDQPGHGDSPRQFTVLEAVQTLEAVAREIGPVDVFAGHSMGAGAGAEAVRKGGIRPGLFMAIGYSPVLGDQAPPLLLLAGRFEQAHPPALLKARTDARLVISPWSDHLLAGFDPVLVNAAVAAACAAVQRTPPAPPTCWRWRLFGAALALLAAGTLASCLADVFPRLAGVRGLLVGGFVAAAFVVTLGGRWLDAMPHWRLQAIALPVAILLAIIAGRFRIPRWSFVALGLLLMLIAGFGFDPAESWPAFVVLVCALLLTPALIVGSLLGWVASRRGSRLQGDVAMAIFVGCAPFQCLDLPRTAPHVSTPPAAIKLDAKLLDACAGEYAMRPDNMYGFGAKVTIRRNGDHLVWRVFVDNAWRRSLELYPESETRFFSKKFGLQVTFIKDDQGEVTAISRQKPGLPDSEGKKLRGK